MWKESVLKKSWSLSLWASAYKHVSEASALVYPAAISAWMTYGIYLTKIGKNSILASGRVVFLSGFRSIMFSPVAVVVSRLKILKQSTDKPNVICIYYSHL